MGQMTTRLGWANVQLNWNFMVREKSNFFVADAQIYLGHKKIFVDKCTDMQ